MAMKIARNLYLPIIGTLSKLGVTAHIMRQVNVEFGFAGLRVLHIVTCGRRDDPKFGMCGVSYLTMGMLNTRWQVTPGTTQLRELGLCCECGSCRRISTMEYLYARWRIVPRKKRHEDLGYWNWLGEEVCDYTRSANECWFRVKYPAHAPGGERQLIVKLVDFSASTMESIDSSPLSDTESDTESEDENVSYEEDVPGRDMEDGEENMEEQLYTYSESSDEDYEDYYNEEGRAEDESNHEVNIQDVHGLSGDLPLSERPRIT
jgi:hypothetical protein